MRTGNAIITTRHNYLEEIITSKNGILIPTHSVEEIIDAVSLLFSDRKS